MLEFMELRHLRYFVAVGEAENVSRAAGTLHVSQPALSRQIRDLESELGVKLLERSAHAVRLTQAGRVFLREAKSVLARTDEAVARAREAGEGERVELNVGYAMSPTVRILPPALRSFQSVHPRVRVRLHDLSSMEMFAGLRAGKLQIAFVVCPSPGRLRGMQFEPLSTGEMILAMSPRHPLARRREVPVKEAAQQPLVVFSKAEYPDYHEALDVLFDGIRPRPRISEEHDSVASLIAAVEAGTGVAVVTESLGCVAGPRLKLKPLTPAPKPFQIGAAWMKGKLSAEAGQFLAATRRAAVELEPTSRRISATG